MTPAEVAELRAIVDRYERGCMPWASSNYAMESVRQLLKKSEESLRRGCVKPEHKVS